MPCVNILKKIGIQHQESKKLPEKLQANIIEKKIRDKKN
jgi:hypothetical protein